MTDKLKEENLMNIETITNKYVYTDEIDAVAMAMGERLLETRTSWDVEVHGTTIVICFGPEDEIPTDQYILDLCKVVRRSVKSWQ